MTSSEKRPRLGYIIGSHVVYGKAVSRLLRSMSYSPIDLSSIIVQVNGSGVEHTQCIDGVRHYYMQGEVTSHFLSMVKFEIGKELDIHYWMYLNCTSECGLKFKELAEAGFNPDADATLAGGVLPLAACSECKHGRAINDLAVYRYEYLLSEMKSIEELGNANTHDIYHHWEGYLYGRAPVQAQYPKLDYHIDRGNLRDVYNTGILRATEYFAAVDLHRYKRNFGQLSDKPGEYDRAHL